MSRAAIPVWSGVPGVLPWMQEEQGAVSWYLYVIRTVDQHLYAGVSTDVSRRFAEHQGRGPKAARYLRAHPPQCLVLSQAIGSRSLALKVEYQFKKLARSQKEHLVRAGALRFDEVSGKIALPAGKSRSISLRSPSPQTSGRPPR